MSAVAEDAMDATSRTITWPGNLCSLVSLLLLILFIASHAWRPDILQAATLLPVFAWGLLGLSCSACARGGTPRRVLLVLWIVAVVWLADAPLSLVRRARPAPQNAPTIRVVSINCLARSSAAEEIAAWNPDVVLIQETPPQKFLHELAKSVFGDDGLAVCSPDTSVLLRGQAQLLTVPGQTGNDMVGKYVGIEATLTNGVQLGIVSLRLLPTPIRLDVWNWQCWQFYADNHRRRRAELAKIVEYLDQHTDLPLVIGGDFNTPARDSVFQLLQPRFREAFQAAGQGWGKTAMNDWPLHRIDQVWVTEPLIPLSVRAEPTKNSDHRAVVCDLAVPAQ
jgi:endonuclease/exonuclease/phosphatase (EEP) superfamily protein YafD